MGNSDVHDQSSAAHQPPVDRSGSGPSLPETGFLRQRQVLAFVPISKSTLWRRVQARSFPQPVKLSAGITAWRAEDLRSWIAEQRYMPRRQSFSLPERRT